jgi:hypothetical protein
MRRSLVMLIVIGSGAIGWSITRDQKIGIPSFALTGSCEYDVTDRGPMTNPPISLQGVMLGQSQRSFSIQNDGPEYPYPAARMERRGEISRVGVLHRNVDDGAYVGRTEATGDPAGRRVIAAVVASRYKPEGWHRPTMTLHSRRGSGCGMTVKVYANDPSATSASAMDHMDRCDYVPPASCGPKRPLWMLLTCRMRSNFPKGRALYVVSSNDGTDVGSTLVDWDMMTAWRFDASSYRPANMRRKCDNPFLS